MSIFNSLDELKKYLAQLSGDALPKKPELGDAPVYERDGYAPPSDEELKGSAQDEYSEYLNKGLSGIEADAEKKREAYEANKEAAGERLSSDVEKLDLNYDKAAKNASDDALKRGLARSSIAAGTIGKLESERAAAAERYNAEYSRFLSETDSKINALAAERTAAINDFNLSHAAKVTERLNQLKRERAERELEAKKYNNSLSEKEYRAGTDKLMNESDLYSEALSQREKENKLKEDAGQARYAEAYDAADRALSSMGKDKIREALSDPDVKNALGDYYYYKLYGKYAK